MRATPLPIAVPKPGEIDWGALVPRVIGGEVGPFVPAPVQKALKKKLGPPGRQDGKR